MNIAVIGLGAAGASTCRQLARRGHKVSAFEQFTIGSDKGSSFGESRIIRYTYPDAFYTRLMGRAYDLWREIQVEARQELLVQTGIMIIGTPHQPAFQDVVSSLRASGVEFTLITPEECKELAPAIRLQSHECAIFQAEGGFLRATRCVQAISAQAANCGAILLENMEVRSIEDSPTGVDLVFKDGSRRSFDKVVVAAGPWVGKLLSPSLPVTVTRQEIGYFKIDHGAQDFESNRMPVWIDLKNLNYGFPLDGVIDGVKAASHKTGAIVDPDRLPRSQDSLYQQALAADVQKRLPGLSDRIVKSQVCMYTNTPDEDFILDWAPGSDRVYIVSGCSGHGFKFTPLLGEIAAAAVTGDDLNIDVSRFSLARLSQTDQP